MPEPMCRSNNNISLIQENKIMSEANFEEQKKRIVDTLSTMFAYLGLNGEFRLESKPNNRIGVKISSSDVGRIIGRRGQTLESLQLILNRIVG